MCIIVNDDEKVARVHISWKVLQRFLRSSDEVFSEQKKTLSVREGVIACQFNRIRIKRLSGNGWYQLSGYRQDGSDLQIALAQLSQASREVELSERVFNGAVLGTNLRTTL